MDLSSYLDDFGRRDWRETEEGTVRIAMIGIGWWTRDHAIPAVDAIDLCKTTVLVSGDREKAEAAADKENVEHGITYDEFHDGVAADSYDAIYISTPNALHLPYATTAADLGKHVLCEKPMESSIERAETMVDVCDRGGVKLMIGYRMQTEPAIRRARECIQDGFIGDPAFVNGHMTQNLLDMIPDTDQWRLDPDLAGRGTSVTDLGIYPINTSRFVLDADPQSVIATMNSTTNGFERVPDERARFELEFEDGTFALCSASQNAQRSGRFEVIGTAGRITLEPAFFADGRRTLTLERDGASAEIAFEAVDQMAEEFEYFADRVLSGGQIHPDGAHGLIDMQVIESIYDAAETSERVLV